VIVTIAGVLNEWGGADLSAYLDRQAGFSLDATIGSRMDTLSLTLFDPAGILVIPERAEIVVYDFPGCTQAGGVSQTWLRGSAPIVDPPAAPPLGPPALWTPRLFGGYVSSVDYTLLGAQRSVAVHAQDYTIRNKTTVVNRAYGPDQTHPAGWTDDQIVRDLFRTYRADIDTANVVSAFSSAGTTMPVISFPTHTLEQFFERIIKITQGWYRIDYYKRLFYAAIGSGPGSWAPFGISDTPNASSFLNLLMPTDEEDFEGGIANWAVYAQRGADPVQTTLAALHGTASMLLAGNATSAGAWIEAYSAAPLATGGSAGNFVPGSNGTVAVIPGTTYTALISGRAATTSRSWFANLVWLDASGAVLSFTSGSAVTLTSAGWQQLTVTGTAPATAAYAVLGLASGSPGLTTPAFVQGNADINPALAAGAQTTVTFTNPTTAGTLLLAWCVNWQTPDLPTAPAGWTVIASTQDIPNNLAAVLCMLPGNPGGYPSTAFTSTASVASDHDVLFGEFSGVAATSPIDVLGPQSLGLAGTKNVSLAQAAPTTFATDLVVALFTDEGQNTTWTPGTGYSLVTNTSTEVMEYKVTAVTGTQTGTATNNFADTWGGAIVSFKPGQALAPVPAGEVHYFDQAGIFAGSVAVWSGGGLPLYGAEQLHFAPDFTEEFDRIWVVGGQMKGVVATYTLTPSGGATAGQWTFPMPAYLDSPSTATVKVGGSTVAYPDPSGATPTHGVGVLGQQGDVTNPAGFAMPALVGGTPPLLALRTPATAGQVVQITGQFRYPLIQVVTDHVLASKLGGNIFEKVLRDQRITDQNLAIQYGQQNIVTQGYSKKGGSCIVDQKGIGSFLLQPGQYILISHAKLFAGGVLPGGVTSASFLITGLEWSLTEDVVNPWQITITFADRPAADDSDLLDHLVGEQGRINAALQQTDINQTVTDLQSLLDTLGFTEKLVVGNAQAKSTYHYGDASARYNAATYS
jgi:hypothetical protein